MDEPKLELGFRFIFPHAKGREFIVARGKNIKFLEIQSGTKMSPQHVEKYIKLGETDKWHFARKLQKELFRENIDFLYNLTENFVIVLMDKIFLEKNVFSKNEFFRIVRKIYNTTMILVFLIQDFFADEFFPKDFTIDKK